MCYRCGKHDNIITMCLQAMEVMPEPGTIRGLTTSTARGMTMLTVDYRIKVHMDLQADKSRDPSSLEW
jgi:hypothetical protein